MKIEKDVLRKEAIEIQKDWVKVLANGQNEDLVDFAMFAIPDLLKIVDKLLFRSGEENAE